MKIKQISIKEFLAIKHLELDLQTPINLIIGENEQGKSSLRDGIQWCLTGTARGLKTHSEQAHLIHDSGKAAEVTITHDDGQAITRRKTPKSPPTVEGTLPPDLSLVAILSDPLTFLSWPDVQRRETLFRLIPGLNPSPEDIAARLRQHVPDPNFSLSNLATLAGTKGFKAAENEAIAKRRESKRTLEELKVEEPEDRATIGGRDYILPDIQEAEIQGALVKLRADRDKLITKRGKVEGEIENLPQLEANLEELKKSRFQPSELPDSQSIGDQETAIAIQKESLKKLKADLEAAQITQEAFPAFCPAIASAQVPCPRAGELLSGEPPDAETIEQLDAAVLEKEEHIQALEKKLEQDNKRLKIHQEHETEIANLETKIKDLQSKQESAEATKPLDEKIAAIDTRIENGQALHDAVRDFWRQKDAADQARERIDQIKTEITNYDVLAKALAPDGIPSQLIKETLGPVNEVLAQASSYLFQNQPPVELTGELEVYRGKTPYSCLSKSARYRVGICFQYALAILTRSRLLMIDEGDILDPLNRACLIEFLLDIAPQFDTILVFATSNEARPSPVPDLLMTWWLNDGHISQVTEEIGPQWENQQDQAAG